MALIHPGDDDTVLVSVWLPPKENWNKCYAATGGGGLGADYDFNMISPLTAGFATSFTDAGLTLNNTISANTGLWGLKEEGTVNEALFENLGYRSVHDMAVASKDIINQYYGTDADYSYWTGCSQGGRQGYAAAAKFSTDFDGILAASPARSFDHVGMSTFWPVVVMQNEGEFVPSCVFREFEKAIVKHCDPRDGLADGLISDYDLLMSCSSSFSPSSLVGKKVACPEAGNTTITITPRHANIVKKILRGPSFDEVQYWFGLAPGASFSGTADTVFDKRTHKWIPQPFAPAFGWLKNIIAPQMAPKIQPRNALRVLFRNPRKGLYTNGTIAPFTNTTTAPFTNTSTTLIGSTDLPTLSYAQYLEAFKASLNISSPYLGDGFLDLAPFHAAGGKLLSWVGLADQFIHPMHVLDFHRSVEATLEDDDETIDINSFYRLFTASGVGHCGGGVGATPANALGALVEWVEHGNAPETLAVKVTNSTERPIDHELCLYPRKKVPFNGTLTCRDPRMVINDEAPGLGIYHNQTQGYQNQTNGYQNQTHGYQNQTHGTALHFRRVPDLPVKRMPIPPTPRTGRAIPVLANSGAQSTKPQSHFFGTICSVLAQTVSESGEPQFPLFWTIYNAFMAWAEFMVTRSLFTSVIVFAWECFVMQEQCDLAQWTFTLALVLAVFGPVWDRYMTCKCKGSDKVGRADSSDDYSSDEDEDEDEDDDPP